MKKKMVSILTAAFCVSALLAGCGFADTAKTSASSAGAASSSADGTTTFTVGFDAEYPPYGYMDDETGDYTGFDLELAEAVCEIYGWKLVKTPINWDAKDTELNSGAIDCIWNGFTMNGREDDYTWSDPYVDNSQVMVVSENSGINSLSDLAGKTVGVQAASAALDLLQSEEEGGQKELADTFAALQQFPDYNNAFVELQAGSIDAVAMDIGVAKYQLESRGEGYKILDEHLNSEKYAIGFKKGNTELCDKVNEGLQQVLADGTFDKLAEKYGIADMVCLEKKGESSSMKLSMILSQLSTGMAGTISIFVLTLVFSLPLGLLIAFGRMSKNRIVSGIFRLYISLMRGTPLMLQLMVVYFGPFYLFGMNIGKWRFPAIITGFALNYGAYFAEIYRSGIVSMDRGQYEAAKLLGYSKGQTFVRIILPQVVKRILPAITNEVITLVKDTSLAFSISYVEMFTIAKQIAAAKTTMVPFVAAGIFYYIFNFVVAWVMELLEKKFSYYH